MCKKTTAKWYDILLEQPKEKAEKAQICHILLIWISYDIRKLQ